MNINKTFKDKKIARTERGKATVFLHGFTGSSQSWVDIIENFDGPAISIDIPGHAKSNISSKYGVSDWINDLSKKTDTLNIEKFNVCAYSMGGRLAIAYAAKYPNRINHLILESTSMGISDNKIKNKRLENDLELSRLIESDYSSFLDRWEQNPLFSMQKKRNKKAFLLQRKERMRHNPLQLSQSLKTFSQGSMKSYEFEFSNFTFPISIINGNEDEKYIEIGRKMCKLNHNCSQYILKAGHNVHLENPNDFMITLKKILNSNP
tara:strand:+ start:8718 stop:9509 length:792 start_codon:yes stop_codon:yes gene_type:complete